MKVFLRKWVEKFTQNSFNQALTIFSSNISKASANIQLRNIQHNFVPSWEFSGFSQNGEDGITEYLTRFIEYPNEYFVEIGASDLTENNTSFFAFCRRFTGLAVEGSRKKWLIGERILSKLGMPYLECCNIMVNRKNLPSLLEKWVYKNPDIFSLDIDSVDYYLMEDILTAGYKPKICIVEYNSTFGDSDAITIPFSENFDWTTASPNMTYWGVSVRAWKKLFARFGYKFLSVERSGSNAFFVCPGDFKGIDFEQNSGLDYADNRSQKLFVKKDWQERFEKIKHLPYNKI